ncbi:MAG: tripartite tricarboxylate transporter substrate binding protein BugD [Burkholderiales bacterium]|nr:tripartite tricarboxylate transporter substrate binding protein BugD [Burkholderiales bacterium]
MLRKLTTVLLALGAATALAQPYPSKPITILVPAAAGGPSDTVARVLAPALAKELKDTVIIENAGGAGGTIGAAKVARAPGDGYTLYLYHIAHSTWPALYRKLPFDVVKDFEPIGLVNDVPMTLVGRKDLPAKNFKELLAWIKANGKNVTIGNAGVGSASHLCGLLFMQAIQTELTPVPYKGTGPAMNDLLGGQIDLICDQSTNTTSQIRSGKINVYAVTTPARLPTMKDVPTLQELGLTGFELSAWHGLWAPKGTPKPIVDQLSKALQVAIKDPAVTQRFADLGAVPVTEASATPAALSARVKSEIDRWTPIIKAAGQYAD